MENKTISNGDISRSWGLDTFIPLLAILSGVASAVIYWWMREGLWEDEVIALTHGLQSFPSFFVQVLRNDIHPFVYFLFLKLWMYVGASDSWMLLSSLVSSLFSTLVIAYVTYKKYGKAAALWASALFCVLPNYAWASANLRMYALLPALAVAVWYVNCTWLSSERRSSLIGILLFEILLGYIHAIEFFFLAFIALAAFFECKNLASRKAIVSWWKAQIFVAVCMLPLPISALIRGTEPLATPNFLSVLIVPAQLFTGWTLLDQPLFLVAGGVIFFCLLGLGIKARQTRIMVLLVPCGVLLVATLLSCLGKPMFKPPVFTANLVPFLCMAAAVGVTQSAGKGYKYFAGSILLALSVFTWPWAGIMRAEGTLNTYSVADYIAHQATEGDVVIIPNVSIYWGVLRYAVDPQWGQPLDIMPLQDKPMWSALKTRLGPDLVGYLRLTPKADFVENKSVKFVIGADARQHTSAAKRVWVIHKRTYKETVLLGNRFHSESVQWFGNEFSVVSLVLDQDGQSSLSNPVFVGNEH